MLTRPVLYQQFSHDRQDYEAQSDNTPPWLTSIQHISPDPSLLVPEKIDPRKHERVLLISPSHPVVSLLLDP
ncbi:hypothetical protein AMATHDRAFT_63028 [Amanita thiersii Skay4041]|uniref:Uncharacterized protein n=1 Tax=Amanita thiersii Skay4041 TaxID=703135 RepID=A0A2A9NMR0_9AGAR|nr:hypothetical protein AMATHDRAFT_63028 [Amanita thiersii Skay4041]